MCTYGFDYDSAQFKLEDVGSGHTKHCARVMHRRYCCGHLLGGRTIDVGVADAAMAPINS